ncbi:MAG: sugar phosphate isomerase/epimerase [Spirochaetales bacterium]|nr:sugar phosphate isomerase/epimerase [Spirochaetales bacterium]
MLQSISTAFTNMGSLEDKLAVISAAGFTHINIDEYLAANLIHCGEKRIDDFAALLMDFNLDVDWVHAPVEKIRLYTRDMRVWTKSLGLIFSTIKLAEQLQARSVIIHAFDYINRPPENFKISYIQIRNALEILLEAGDKAGIQLALENLIHSFMNNIILELIQRLPDIGLCLDTGHAEISVTWSDFLSLSVLPQIVALNLNDNHGFSDEHLIPGDGIIDFYRCIKILFEYGYNGIWGVDCIQNAGNYKGNPAVLAKKAFSFIDHLLIQQNTTVSVR